MLVVVALAFDFMNGFHDAANSIATVVSTGVLRPGQAVLMAAGFNFIAVFVFHLSVAATVGKGIVEPGAVDAHVVFGALVGAAYVAAVCALFAANAIGGYPFVGTPDKVAGELANISRAGVRGVAVSFVNYLDELPYFCVEVLPRLAKAGLRDPAIAKP